MFGLIRETALLKTKANESKVEMVRAGDTIWCKMHNRQVIIIQIESGGWVLVKDADTNKKLKDYTHVSHCRSL